MNTIDVWLPIVSVLAVYTARMVELGTRRATVPGPVKEHLTFRLFMLAGGVMLVGGTIEFLLRQRLAGWPAYLTGWQGVAVTAGWACAIVSFWMRRRAIAALGKFWSLHVEIRENHEFVRSGPFRIVRHPTYFSMILELLCGGLILSAYVTLGVVILIFIPALLLRVRLEEAALVEKFGSAYEEYQRQTPAIIPYKWPTSK